MYDQWMTPPDIIELAREMMQGIDLDPASHPIAQQYIKAKEFCALEIGKNGLIEEWSGNVWCNPPYSRENIGAFVGKLLIAQYEHSFKQCLFLVNSATDAQWYHHLLNNCSAFCLWKGRIKFWKIENGEALEKWEGERSKELSRGKAGNSPRYLNTLFYFGDNVNRFRYYFGDKGFIVSKEDVSNYSSRLSLEICR